ncbi:RHS repeat-associated core domain-containing protein [Methylomonas sp. YC3]
MVRAETPQGTAQYRYDALGRRIVKLTAQGETRFQYDGPRLLAESDYQRSRTYLFEPGSFRPLALHEQDSTQASGTTYHYHLDHLGTPRELTDTDGGILWSARYSAYGNLALADIEEIDNPLSFQGQYYDQETGLHCNLNRYYDPNAGRFIHQDPIGLEGGANVYRYAPNPVKRIDPLGLTGKDCAGGANAGGYSNYSDEQFITEIARRSEQKVGGTGAVAGTHKHTYAEKLMNRYQRMTGQRQNLVTEQSYLGGVQVPRGHAR